MHRCDRSVASSRVYVVSSSIYGIRKPPLPDPIIQVPFIVAQLVLGNPGKRRHREGGGTILFWRRTQWLAWSLSDESDGSAPLMRPRHEMKRYKR
jgi:hypothetical protein